MNGVNKTVTRSLMAILMLVIGLRFHSIFQGLPFSDITDEVAGVAGTLLMASTKSLIPNPDGNYTSLFNYFLAVVYAIIFLMGKVTGWFHDKYDFALLYMTNPWIFYFTARLITFFSGVGAVWYTWKSGLLLTGSRLGGVLSAIVLGLSSVHIYLSMVGKVDALMVFFVSAYLYQTVKIIKNEADVRTCVSAGILFGLAVASKLNAALLVPALPIALLLAQRDGWSRQKVARSVKLICIFGAVSLISFLIGNPAFLVSPKTSLYLTTIQGKSNAYVIFTAGGTPIRWLWVVHDLISQEGAIGVVIIISFFYSIYLILKRKRYELLLPIIFIAGFIAYVGSWSRASLHYLLPVYPLFALVSAVMLTDLAESGEKRPLVRTIGMTAIILMVTFGLWKVAARVSLTPRDSTRVAAKKWMEQHIPTKTLVAYDDYAASPPFFSPEIYLKSGTKAGYEKYVPEPLKERLLAYADTHTSYRSMRLRYYLDAPLFPSEWSPEFRKAHENDPNVGSYYRLHFDTPEELYKKNVEYLIVCEAYYSQFFTIQYPPDNPIYAFNRRGLAFYESLFGANKYYAAVAEFNASKELYGNKIMIFRKRGT